MSTYYRYTKHPDTGRWENAKWIDDYYEHYHYGVKFPDGKIFDPWKTTLIQSINSEEAEILNARLERG